MVTKSLLELNELIPAVEARLPANVNAPANEKHVARARGIMARYFEALERAFPYGDIDVIYKQFAIKESAEKETRDAIEMLIGLESARLEVELAGEIVDIYIDGSLQVMDYADVPYEGPPMKEAIDFANKRCAKMITKMDEESKRRIAKIVSDGIKNKRGIPGLRADIRGAFGDMSRFRADMIARTETNNALSQAVIDRGHELGVDGKEWMSYGGCPICETNSGDGVIPIDEIFSSGDERPPAHPNCKCNAALAKLPGATRESAFVEIMTPGKWKAEYKKGIPHWAKDMAPSIFAKEFAKLMKDYEIDSVLEVGCGNGRDSILFAKAGFEVTSIDIVPKAIELAKDNAKKVEVDIKFKVANAEKLPFKDGSFGGVFTLSVLHSTDLKKSLPEAARVLQAGGVAFIYIYGDTQFKNGKPKEITIELNDYIKALKDAGFEVLKTYTEQEEEFDEFGEKHRIIVALLGKVKQ